MGVYILVLILVMLLVSLYVICTYDGPDDKVIDLDSTLTIYDDLKYNNGGYLVGYDPVDVGGGFNSTISKRYYLAISKPTYSSYNDGEIAYITITFDIDYLKVGDIVTIGDRLSFISIEPNYRGGSFYSYKLAPTKKILSTDLDYITSGTKAYRDMRELTEDEKEYTKEHRIQQQIDYWNRNFRSRGRTSPHPIVKPSNHRQSTVYASTSNHNSRPSDIVDDILYNPLLSPFSPISVWSSGGDDIGSSSSSYDSSGSSDCGGGGGDD